MTDTHRRHTSSSRASRQERATQHATVARRAEGLPRHQQGDEAIGKTGIGKGRKNMQQGYSFRGVDDVYNALSPFLAEHGLCILPRMLSRELTERESAKGAALFYVVVVGEFDFVCAEDGSKHTVRTYGEAMDSADKATNKAMSAAYKYACMQAFSIPTEGDNDADRTTHEVKPKVTPMPREELTVAQMTRLAKVPMP